MPGSSFFGFHLSLPLAVWKGYLARRESPFDWIGFLFGICWCLVLDIKLHVLGRQIGLHLTKEQQAVYRSVVRRLYTRLVVAMDMFAMQARDIMLI